MMIIKQISVFIENKSGRLADIVGIIGKHNIDISAMSIADTSDFGILRLIVNDPEKAERVLKEEGVTVKATDVIAFAVEDRPGGLANTLRQLTDNGVSIEYMYAFVGKSDKGAIVVIRVDKPDDAVKTLSDTAVNMVEAKEVYRM